MAISYFGSSSNPTDNGSLGIVTPSVTPPSDMQDGDLVLLFVCLQVDTATISIANDGGQTWTTETSGVNLYTHQLFWCRFNGTWSANPSTTNSASGGYGVTLVMHVFRPTSSLSVWEKDVSQVAATYSVPSSPYDVTIAGINTLTDNALVLASWMGADDNTWAIQTAGWSNPGGAQYRNTEGFDSSVSQAYKIQASAGATGDVTNRQTANGGDRGVTLIIAFKEVSPTIYEESVTETPTSADAVTGYVLHTPSVTEMVAGSDVVICSRDTDTGDVTETFFGSDVVGGYLNTQTMDLTEATESADVVAATAGFEDDVTENVAGSDVVIGYQGEIVSVTETIAGADTLDIDLQSGYQETISESLFMWEAIKTGWNVPVAETLTVVDTATSPIMAKLAEWLMLNETIVASWAGVEVISDGMTLLDIAKYQLPVTVSDGVTITDTPTVSLTLSILENMGFTELLSAIATFQKTLDETVTLSDSVLGAYSATISDVLDAVDAASVITTFLDTISDSITATDAVTDIITILLSASDSLTIADTVTANGTFYHVINETLKLSVTIELDGESYECWVLNTGKFYPSIYSGFDFNSYASFQGRNYGANSTGIFELVGSTDNGTTIHAGVELPDTKFGSHNQKRFRKAYVGISGTRPLMQVETEDGETKTYEIDTEGEVDMTRDMRSKSWKLRLTDFTSLDFIKLFPMVISK